MKDNVEYYMVSAFTFALLFGGMIVSGWMSGIDWSSSWIDFSWSMLNTEELKEIVLID